MTVTQTGDEAVTASFRDDLNAVTGATYITGSATTDRGTISGNLDWNGTLDVNQTATIRYQMRINNDTATGATVKNTVTPGENGTCTQGACETTTTIVEPTTPTVPPTGEPGEPTGPAEPGDPLPETGAASMPWLIAGSGLLILGLVTVLLTLRRRPAVTGEQEH